MSLVPRLRPPLPAIPLLSAPLAPLMADATLDYRRHDHAPPHPLRLHAMTQEGPCTQRLVATGVTLPPSQTLSAQIHRLSTDPLAPEPSRAAYVEGYRLKPCPPLLTLPVDPFFPTVMVLRCLPLSLFLRQYVPPPNHAQASEEEHRCIDYILAGACLLAWGTEHSAWIELDPRHPHYETARQTLPSPLLVVRPHTDTRDDTHSARRKREPLPQAAASPRPARTAADPPLLLLHPNYSRARTAVQTLFGGLTEHTMTDHPWLRYWRSYATARGPSSNLLDRYAFSTTLLATGWTEHAIHQVVATVNTAAQDHLIQQRQVRQTTHASPYASLTTGTQRPAQHPVTRWWPVFLSRVPTHDPALFLPHGLRKWCPPERLYASSLEWAMTGSGVPDANYSILRHAHTPSTPPTVLTPTGLRPARLMPMQSTALDLRTGDPEYWHVHGPDRPRLAWARLLQLTEEAVDEAVPPDWEQGGQWITPSGASLLGVQWGQCMHTVRWPVYDTEDRWLPPAFLAVVRVLVNITHVQQEPRFTQETLWAALRSPVLWPLCREHARREWVFWFPGPSRVPPELRLRDPTAGLERLRAMMQAERPPLAMLEWLTVLQQQYMAQGVVPDVKEDRIQTWMQLAWKRDLSGTLHPPRATAVPPVLAACLGSTCHGSIYTPATQTWTWDTEREWWPVWTQVCIRMWLSVLYPVWETLFPHIAALPPTEPTPDAGLEAAFLHALHEFAQSPIALIFRSQQAEAPAHKRARLGWKLIRESAQEQK